ncbi:MAG: SpoIIE family protein phosphatase [Chloroflexota bacterium]
MLTNLAPLSNPLALESDLPYNQTNMTENGKLLAQLKNLNHITDTLNRADNVPDVLELVLTRLVDLMGLQTGWIFLRDSNSQNQWYGRGYSLAAYYNLPPAMAPDKPLAWKRECDCAVMCSTGQLNDIFIEVRCRCLSNIRGDMQGLTMHASAPLISNDQALGNLNVAAPNWDDISDAALVLLSNIGSQIGMALERGNLLEMIQQQRIHEQATLLDLSTRLLNQGADLENLMAQATDDICALLQADACALLLPDDDPQWLNFQATTGWNTDPMMDCRQVPADETSGPGLVIQTQQPFLIEDLHEAKQAIAGSTASWTTTWLKAEEFRGHAVVPLLADTQSIGAMVINMRQPRLLDKYELRLFRLMANQVAIAIEKAQLVRERIQRERLEEEMVIGRRIQLSLLPESDPDIPGWDVASLYRSAAEVGGDFYDFFQLDNKGNRLGMVIADVSGKGVSAALFMALSRSIIRTKAFTGRKTWDVLRRANRLIYKDSRSGLFLTAFYATLEPKTGRMVFTNAGHNRPIWYNIRTGTLKELATTGIVLGVFDRIHLGEDEIQVEPGDFLILYTDGVTEAMNQHRELFGEERLYEIIQAKLYANAQDMMDAILDAVQDFVGDTPPSDDVTLLVIRRDPA